MLFDAHAHVNNEGFTDEIRGRWADAIAGSDLCYVMDQGTNIETSRQAVKDTEDYDWCYAVVGCHPHDTKTMDDAALEAICDMTKEPKVCGIGEIGLDFYYDYSDRDVQREWFRRQIRLANELRLPIVIHSRDAEAETMQILKEEGAFSEERRSWFPKRRKADDMAGAASDARVLIHCFSGSPETARQYVELGATISICGPVTFKNSKKLVEVVRRIPIEYLTVETDAPFLTPEPHRGKPNIPTYVEHVARRVAVLKGMTYDEVANITCRNAKRFYGIED